VILGLFIALARAQDPAEDDEYVSEEIVVYGKLRVDQAREKVVEDLKNLGYTKLIEKDGAIVMRHESPWRGDVWLHDDGWMRIRRQPVRLEAPPIFLGKKNSVGAWMGCVLYPFICVRPGGQVVSTRKFQAVETRTAAAVEGDVSEWGDRVADLAIETKADALPDRLQALWDEGQPLEPGQPVLVSASQRKAAILRYWETRTDNEWGETMRRVVEGFVRAEVQHSDDPFTSGEIRKFNRRSRAGREFSLERRVADEGR